MPLLFAETKCFTYTTCWEWHKFTWGSKRAKVVLSSKDSLLPKLLNVIMSKIPEGRPFVPESAFFLARKRKDKTFFWFIARNIKEPKRELCQIKTFKKVVHSEKKSNGRPFGLENKFPFRKICFQDQRLSHWIFGTVLLFFAKYFPKRSPVN